MSGLVDRVRDDSRSAVTRFAPLAFFLALPLGACSVSGAGISPSDVAFNQCSSDSDCPGNGTCNQNVCQGGGGTLTSLLVAVTPPPTLVGINSVTYFEDFTKGSAFGSGGGRQDLAIDSVNVGGFVQIDTSACLPSYIDTDAGSSPSTVTTSMLDGSFPALLTFTPSQHALGIATDSFTAGPNHTGFAYAVTLPAGEYDVYVKPAYQLSSMQQGILDCQVPPRLFLNQTIKSTFTIKLPPPTPLSVNVTWPLAATYQAGAEQVDPFLANPLDGWTLDLIDQASGRTLSTTAKLSDYLTPPVPGATSVTYSVSLRYSPVYATLNGMTQPTSVGDEIIRLMPPTNDPRFTDGPVPFTAPTVLAQLDGALVDADGKPAPAQIVLNTPLPPPVTVQFQTALGDLTPVPSGVLITAKEIAGITGLSTSFVRSIQVGADGNGTVDLLPGRYRVVAAPKAGCTADGCLALTETEWVVAGAPASQAGKLIQFVPATLFSGNASINGGGPVTGATVHATASSLVVDQNVLNVGDGSVALVPRASSGLVGSDGSFSFEADSGLFDLRVEPDPSTGYGWLVAPGLGLPSGSDYLSSLGLDLPIIYRGSVTSLSSGSPTPIPRALVRAYAFVNSTGVLATSTDKNPIAMQVAETYADDAGNYRLLIPKELQNPP
jgi:hypothetical protein